MFRLSKETDKVSIEHLLKKCFADFPIKMGALENLDGRYLLYRNMDTGEILGMTGLIWSDSFEALEVDWSCVDPNARNRGIMHDLFKRICGLTDERIYCSCWRTDAHEPCHIKSIMQDFDFKEVVHGCNVWCKSYNCKCLSNEYSKECVYLKETGCSCWEDLYVRN